MERQNFGLNPPLNLPSTSGFPGAKSTKHFAWFRNTKMKSAAPGLNTSPVEVTNISRHGFWRLSLFVIPRDSLWSVNPMPELGWIVRRKDPSNCSTNPGRSAGQAFCKHVFWIYPRGMSAGVPGAGNFGALRTPISAPGFTQHLSVRTVSASPADRRDVRRSRSSRFVPVRLVERREACRVK